MPRSALSQLPGLLPIRRSNMQLLQDTISLVDGTVQASIKDDEIRHTKRLADGEKLETHTLAFLTTKRDKF